MKTKTLLKKCRHEKREILILTEKVEQLEASVLPKSIPIKDDKIQSSVDPDPMGEKIVTCVELKKELDRQLARLLEHELEAHKAIARVENSQYRQVLELYYLSFDDDDDLYTWDAVADKMGFSIDHVFKLHREALSCVS